MASSGRIQDISNITSVYTLRADWSVISTDIQNNKHRIGVNCYVFRNDGYSGSAWSDHTNERKTTLIVDGVSKGVIAGPFDTRNGQIANVGYYEFDVYHNADGTKTASAQFNLWIDNGSSLDGTSIITGNMVLDTIPRESLFASTADFNIGDSAVFLVTNPGNLWSTLEIKCEGVTLASTSGILKGTIRLDITANTLYQLTPNSNNLPLTAELKTYASYGGAQIGSTQSATINANVTNSNPTFSSVSYEMNNPYWVETAVYGNGFSYSFADLQIFGVTAINYATIDHIEAKCGSWSANSTMHSDDTYSIGITSIESDAYQIIVHDSRGNTATYDGAFTGVYRNYKKPYIESLSLVRDQLINATTYLNCVLKIDTNVQVIKMTDPGSDQEPRRVDCYYKETTQNWTAATTLTLFKNIEYYGDKDYIPAPPEMTINGGTVTITNLSINFDTSKQYDFRIRIYDWLTSGYTDIELTSAEPTRCEVMTSTGSVTGFNMVPDIDLPGGVQSRYGFYDIDGHPAAHIQSGSWTPTIFGATTPGSPSYFSTAGNYVLIGKLCVAFFSVNVHGLAGMTGYLRLGGLPFIVSGTTLTQIRGYGINKAGAVGINAQASTSDTSMILNVSYFNTILTYDTLKDTDITVGDFGFAGSLIYETLI